MNKRLSILIFLSLLFAGLYSQAVVKNIGGKAHLVRDAGSVTFVEDPDGGPTRTFSISGQTVIYRGRASYADVVNANVVGGALVQFSVDYSDTQFIYDFKLPSDKSITINWGDGTTSQHTGQDSTLMSDTSSYSSAGTYIVKIEGNASDLTYMDISDQDFVSGNAASVYGNLPSLAYFDYSGTSVTNIATVSGWNTEFFSHATARITGNSSTFDGAGDWLTGLGSLSASDISSTVAGAMYLNFTSGNQAVKFNNAFTATDSFIVKVKAHKVSGTGMSMRIGFFNTTFPTNYHFDITPDTVSRWYYAYLYSFGSVSSNVLYVGALNANNNGTKIAIDEIHVDKVNPSDIIAMDYAELPHHTPIVDTISTISRADQTLLKVAFVGNSLMANSYGGAIPNDEGNKVRPPRLTLNSVPRRMYDYLKYNAPAYRRLDTIWTRSTLSGSDDFSEIISSTTGDHLTPWHPNNTGEKYFRTNEVSAYCEIVVPDGYENFAVVYRTGYQSNSNNMDDSVTVTINGGNISAYGDTLLNEYTAQSAYTINARGFGLNVKEYSGLPAGNNTIRFTKSNDTTEFHLWGGFYWSGNTAVVLNASYGGANIDDLSEMMEVIRAVNDYDLVFFELPIMNNASAEMTDLEQIDAFLDDESKGVLYWGNGNLDFDNVIFFTPHPFGTDPRDDDPNYYTAYVNPTFKESSTLLMKLIGYLGLNYTDVFKLFESDIIRRGGTLEGGQAGAYYTTDGQHPSTDGATKYEDYLIDILNTIPE